MKTGPAHGRPTPLQLARKDEVPPVDPDLIAKAMGERLVQKRGELTDYESCL